MACLLLHRIPSKKTLVSRYMFFTYNPFPLVLISKKVFAGNLAYTTTDEGLKAFFAPVQSDMYVACLAQPSSLFIYPYLSSLSAQVILRGTRSAGYGFVALATAEATQKAVELLNKQDLDGRQVIIEVAKPSDQKDKEKKERRSKRRPGRRGSKAVPGEISEAEANGEPAKEDPTAAPTTDEASKPKKKKKKAPVSSSFHPITRQ
jgi:RNA recognition motif-containing protein